MNTELPSPPDEEQAQVGSEMLNQNARGENAGEEKLFPMLKVIPDPEKFKTMIRRLVGEPSPEESVLLVEAEAEWAEMLKSKVNRHRF